MKKENDFSRVKKTPYIKKLILSILSFFGYSLHRTNIGNNIRTNIDKGSEFIYQKDLLEVENPVIFDVGANVGGITKIYRRLLPLATIYCFEPYSISFDKLLNKVKDDSRIFCHNLALSNSSGKTNLNTNVFSQTNSLLETDHRASLNWGKGLFETISHEEVDTTTIDKFCKENGIINIDVLKMDVQGLEYSVLEGATEMLSDHRISIIYFEIIILPTYKGQYSLKEYLELLDSFGYEFINLYNPNIRRNQLAEMDVLFVSSSFKKGSNKFVI